MIYNITKDNTISFNPVWAKSFRMRTCGMIGRDFASSTFDAMIFEKCNAVHSCFMGIALDLIFTDRSGRIVDIRENFKPWRIAFGSKGAAVVIELPAGRINACKAARGDILNLNAFLCPDEVEKIQAGAILNKASFETAEKRLSEQPLNSMEKREL